MFCKQHKGVRYARNSNAPVDDTKPLPFSCSSFFDIQDEHVDVKHKTCMLESCNLQPIWGDPDQGTPVACTEHRLVRGKER